MIYSKNIDYLILLADKLDLHGHKRHASCVDGIVKNIIKRAAIHPDIKGFFIKKDNLTELDWEHIFSCKKCLNIFYSINSKIDE